MTRATCNFRKFKSRHKKISTHSILTYTIDAYLAIHFDNDGTFFTKLYLEDFMIKYYCFMSLIRYNFIVSVSVM